jgi:hypothetical protein
MMKVILPVLILARGIMPLELALLLSASSRLRELEPAEPKEARNFSDRKKWLVAPRSEACISAPTLVTI